MNIPSNLSSAWVFPGTLLRVRKRKLNDQPTTQQLLIDTTCAYFKTTENHLKLDTAKHDVSYHRQILTYLLYTYTSYRMVDIANLLNRERTSMTYARDKVRVMLSAKHDNEYKKDIKSIINLIPEFITT
jgi:chromosomal replication initiation ATPase DnaA